MRRKIPSWLPAYAVVAAVFAVMLATAGLRDQGANQDALPDAPAAQQDSPSTPQPAFWSHGQDGSAQNGEEHWEKHGRDFSQYHSAEEYERGASDFIHHPPPGTLEKHRANGDTLFYDPQTNTFAVENKRGEPRTFFRPDSGRGYWQRQ